MRFGVVDSSSGNLISQTRTRAMISISAQNVDCHLEADLSLPFRCSVRDGVRPPFFCDFHNALAIIGPQNEVPADIFFSYGAR